MNNKKLEDLVNCGIISSYEYLSVDEEGNVQNEVKGFCNTERLILNFPNGKSLKIDAVCSGSSQNIIFFME